MKPQLLLVALAMLFCFSEGKTAKREFQDDEKSVKEVETGVERRVRDAAGGPSTGCYGYNLPDGNYGEFSNLESCDTYLGEGIYYPNDAEFYFLLNTTADKPLWVNIYYTINIESHYRCYWDGFMMLSLYPEPIRICGQQSGKLSLPVDERWPHVVLWFFSDYSVVRSGFEFNYTVTDTPTFTSTSLPHYTNNGSGNKSCMKILTGNNGSVDSRQECGDGVSNYPNSASYAISLVPSDITSNQSINIENYVTSIETHYWCFYDSLIFSVGTGPGPLGRQNKVIHCGTQTGSFSISVAAGQHVVVRLISDWSITKEGFSFDYFFSGVPAFTTTPLQYNGRVAAIPPPTSNLPPGYTLEGECLFREDKSYSLSNTFGGFGHPSNYCQFSYNPPARDYVLYAGYRYDPLPSDSTECFNLRSLIAATTAMIMDVQNIVDRCEGFVGQIEHFEDYIISHTSVTPDQVLKLTDYFPITVEIEDILADLKDQLEM